MICYLTLSWVLTLHRQIIEVTGGSPGLRELGALESALAQRHMTFGGQDLYPQLADKVTALGFSLINNHPFVDGNKRIGYAAMEVFLVLNAFELVCDVDEQEEVILAVAAGQMGRQEFTVWVRSHVRELDMLRANKDELC